MREAPSVARVTRLTWTSSGDPLHGACSASSVTIDGTGRSREDVAPRGPSSPSDPGARSGSADIDASNADTPAAWPASPCVEFTEGIIFHPPTAPLITSGMTAPDNWPLASQGPTTRSFRHMLKQVAGLGLVLEGCRRGMLQSPSQ